MIAGCVETSFLISHASSDAKLGVAGLSRPADASRQVTFPKVNSNGTALYPVAALPVPLREENGSMSS